MEKIEFKIKLKKASLNKKSFAQIFGLKYQSVNSWGNNGRTIPYWVEQVAMNIKPFLLYNDMEQLFSIY